jgi:hypothetical protein
MLEPLPWRDLPAGPLSGAEVTVWTARTGTVVHGDRTCPSLARSVPTPHRTPLGEGVTLGELAFPDTTHCPLQLDNDELNAYLTASRSVAAQRQDAIDALTAYGATPAAQARYGGYAPDVEGAASLWGADARWRWWEFAGVLAGALLDADVTETPVAAAIPEPLSRVHRAACTAVAAAARELTDWMANPRWAWEAQGAAQNLYGHLVAMSALADYDARMPGPLWCGWRDTGWRSVRAVLNVTHPDAEQARGGLVRAWLPVLNGGEPDAAALAADLLEPLEEAWYFHGQESYPFHRLHAAVNEPARTWTDILTAWLHGAHFSFGPRSSERARLAHPDVLAAARSALAAADAAQQGWLLGMGYRGQVDHVIAFPAERIRWWQVAALVLTHPHVTASVARLSLVPDTGHSPPTGTPRRTRWVVLLAGEPALATLGDEPRCKLPHSPDPHILDRCAAALARLPLTAERAAVAGALREACGVS